MNKNLSSELALPDQLGIARFSKLAPRPKSLSDTGLRRELVVELITKHILDKGTPTLVQLADALCLPGGIIESLLDFMRIEALIEIRPNHENDSSLRYALTERGRAAALDAMLRSGYLGPAPVTLAQYSEIIRRQSVHKQQIPRDTMHRAFLEVVIDGSLLDQLGSSMNSGRAIFLYGDAGTGKTYISQRLTRLFADPVLVPNAIAVDNRIIQVFEPTIHDVLDFDSVDEHHLLNKGHDRRFKVCKRPVAITGGELTAEMLEVMYEPAVKLYEAPLQMRANNGIFIIDDLGRQRIDVQQLFNRWIVPLEERQDYLSLQSGRHFSVPFDMILIFSTNIHPLELADEAFLRRIGYKIEFTPMSPEAYERLWRDTCVEFEVDFDPDVLQFVINDLHGKRGVSLLPCHPRDLISMAIDHAVYTEKRRYIDIEQMRWAWRNYFVSLNIG
jgi:predicted ATPase with chaperone activity